MGPFFDKPYSLLWLSLGGIMSVFAISQISWWLFGRYFPSWRLCMLVHRNSRSWLARERKVLRHMEAPTVLGFIYTALLIPIILLNVTLLAQVFELFVETGERFTLPYIGNYSSFALLTGLLFSLSQKALSLTADVNHRKTNRRSYGIYFIIGLMVLLESGLSLYRGMIMVDEPASTQNLWGTIMSTGGAYLAGLLGFVIPMTIIIIGPRAFLEFIGPVIKNSAILTRFSISTATVTYLIATFGFHTRPPISLPGIVLRLGQQVTNLKKITAELQQSYQALTTLYPKIHSYGATKTRTIAENVKNLDGQVQELDNENAVANYPTRIENKRELARTVVNTKQSLRIFKGHVAVCEDEFVKLGEQNQTLHRTFRRLEPMANDYEIQYHTAKDLLSAVEIELKEDTTISLLANEISKAFSGTKATNELLTPEDLDEIRALVTSPRKTIDKSWEQMTIDTCLTEIDAAKSQIRTTRHLYEKVERWLEEHPPLNKDEIEAGEQTLAAMEKQLIAIAKRLESVEKNQIDETATVQSDLRALAIQYKAFVMWLSLMYPLYKRA